mmetsp:Transcript_101317/g.201318  ORF Transcript_101317/g.201318 Transcript_101317/m.201318 type:complete len:222 (-) Transcript_101317:1300-1965(-)
MSPTLPVFSRTSHSIDWRSSVHYCCAAQLFPANATHTESEKWQHSGVSPIRSGNHSQQMHHPPRGSQDPIHGHRGGDRHHHHRRHHHPRRDLELAPLTHLAVDSGVVVMHHPQAPAMHHELLCCCVVQETCLFLTETCSFLQANVSCDFQTRSCLQMVLATHVLSDFFPLMIGSLQFLCRLTVTALPVHGKQQRRYRLRQRGLHTGSFLPRHAVRFGPDSC